MTLVLLQSASKFKFTPEEAEIISNKPRSSSWFGDDQRMECYFQPGVRTMTEPNMDETVVPKPAPKCAAEPRAKKPKTAFC